MELKEWFQIQKQLDQYIESEHHLENENLFERKVLALLVEIGELANETRCFKFWSKKAASSKDIILEEFVDGVHFILSLGIELSFEQHEFVLPVNKVSKGDLTESFIQMYALVGQLRSSKSLSDYEAVLNQYFMLGIQLGFPITDVQAAYLAKNKINYQRQEQGY